MSITMRSPSLWSFFSESVVRVSFPAVMEVRVVAALPSEELSLVLEAMFADCSRNVHSDRLPIYEEKVSGDGNKGKKTSFGKDGNDGRKTNSNPEFDAHTLLPRGYGV
jgi:hypothetical protein